MKFYKNMSKPEQLDNQDAELNSLIYAAMLKIYANAKDVMERANPQASVHGYVCVKFPQAFSENVNDSLCPSNMYLVHHNDTNQLTIGENDSGLAKEVEDRIFDDWPLVINSEEHGLALSAYDPEIKSFRNIVRLLGDIFHTGMNISETIVNQRYLDPDFLTRLNKMNDELVNHLDGVKLDVAFETHANSI